MSAPNNAKGYYVEGLADDGPANDQVRRLVGRHADNANDPMLTEQLKNDVRALDEMDYFPELGSITAHGRTYDRSSGAVGQSTGEGLK